MANEENFKQKIQSQLLNKHQLNNIRLNYPSIHLFDKPFLGTEEIRQFAYCKRILYFRYVIRAPMYRSYKMEYGVKKHEKLQNVADKSKENFCHKYYNVYLTDAQLGLVGLIDYFEFDGKEAYPVEIKTGNIPPEGLENAHRLQIAAQAMLIESNFDFLVKRARVFYSKNNEYVDYEIKVDDKLRVLELIDEILHMLEDEKIPEPTKDTGKCTDCECRKFCNNI
jgi:CRISPR-associated exonuclease Cas4